ncbi:MAG: helix-turn-helix transcriptional regulator [Clostridia bacterium]|nr:helix-turn-helix transcriptional regulator [Clostridia bacterium]
MIDFTKYNVKIDSAFYIDWGKGAAVARPRKFDALSFRLKGSAEYEYGDKKTTVEKNDLLFVPANFGYKINALKEEEVLVVHFFIENSNFDGLSLFKPLNPDIFRRLFEEMSEVWRKKTVGYAARLYSLFYEVVWQIAVQDEKKKLATKPRKFSEALSYMRDNFTSPETTVETTAKYIGTSTVYLRKIFREEMGVTPLKLLNDMRMDYAEKLLKSGYYKIEELSFLAGFNDPKYFSLLYKKKTGYPPSKRLKKAYASRD